MNLHTRNAEIKTNTYSYMFEITIFSGISTNQIHQVILRQVLE